MLVSEMGVVVYTAIAIKNTIFNWLDLIVNGILSFVMRLCLIKYLGVEILGVDATVVETVNLLNVIELGIQTSITYKMYKPIIDGDVRRQKELFNLYKIAYRIVGCVIICIGMVILPFLPKIVNSNVSLKVVYFAFLIQVLATALRYFTSYYRLLYVVYQRQFVNNIVNILISIILFSIQLISLRYMKNYILYLAVSYIGIGMTWVYYRNRTKIDYCDIVEKTKSKPEDIRSLISDTKEMVVGQAAGYVYGSTDNVLISIFFGSIVTGYVSNYLMVTRLLRAIIAYAGNAISPIWGAKLYSERDEATIKDNYSVSIFVEYCMCLVLLVPAVSLIDEFVTGIWLGDSKYAINSTIYLLIIMDIFLSSIGETNCIILRNLGLFREEKKISLVAMIANIALSIILAKDVGVQGIFGATVIASCLYLFYRSYIVNKYLFSRDPRLLLLEWKDYAIYIASFWILCIAIREVMSFFTFRMVILGFVIKGFLIELLVALYILIVWGNTTRAKIVIGKLRRVI